MSPETVHRVALTAHPSTSTDVVRSMEVLVQGGSSGQLDLYYCLEADLSRLVVPAATAGSGDRTDGLWKHTCFEAFVTHDRTRSYCELNFSPSRQWAAYSFSAYREGMSPTVLDGAPRIVVRRLPQRLELDASVHLPDTIHTGAAPVIRLAIAAVIEEDNGRLSYWAARHAPGKPDFHHPDAFILEL
jgi:hypothetical protein